MIVFLSFVFSGLFSYFLFYCHFESSIDLQCFLGGQLRIRIIPIVDYCPPPTRQASSTIIDVQNYHLFRTPRLNRNSLLVSENGEIGPEFPRVCHKVWKCVVCPVCDLSYLVQKESLGTRARTRKLPMKSSLCALTDPIWREIRFTASAAPAQEDVTREREISSPDIAPSQFL